MAIDRDQKYREMAVRGKYQRLYTHLRSLQTEEWRTSFGEIESVIGFELPHPHVFTGLGGQIRTAATDIVRLLPGLSPDGRRLRWTWILKRCCSDEGSAQRPFASSVLMRCGLSTPRQCGRKA